MCGCGRIQEAPEFGGCRVVETTRLVAAQKLPVMYGDRSLSVNRVTAAAIAAASAAGSQYLGPPASPFGVTPSQPFDLLHYQPAATGSSVLDFDGTPTSCYWGTASYDNIHDGPSSALISAVTSAVDEPTTTFTSHRKCLSSVQFWSFFYYYWLA